LPLGSIPRTLKLMEDLVAIVGSRSGLVPANEHQRIRERADDPSVAQVKLGVKGDLTEVRHGARPCHGSNAGAIKSLLQRPIPQLASIHTRVQRTGLATRSRRLQRLEALAPDAPARAARELNGNFGPRDRLFFNIKVAVNTGRRKGE
jgi:hypothetical protein